MDGNTQAVRDVMESYVAAPRGGDEVKMRTLFHPDAMPAGWLGDTLRDGRPDPLFARVASLKAGDDHEVSGSEAEVVGRGATDRICEDSLREADFDDRCHLIERREGSRILTAKLFHRDSAKG